MEAIWTPQPKPLMMSRPEYEALYGGAAGSGKTDYLVKDNVPVWGKFEYINGRWYAFDNAGFMIKGWFKTDEGWYYLGEDGGILSSQWLEDKGKWYYLTKTGLMATSAKVKKSERRRIRLCWGRWGIQSYKILYNGCRQSS